MSEPLLFNGWTEVLRVVVMAALFYAFVVAVMRSAGNRALAQMRAFDFVTTIALGSVFANAVLDQKVTFAEAAAGFASIALLEWLVTKSVALWPRLGRVIGHAPRLVFYDGRFLQKSMRKARLTARDVEEAIRGKGISSLSRVRAVVLEPAGSLSVLEKSEEESDLLRDVAGREERLPS